MARIPESELARLKAEVSIERLAIARGMKLTRKGRDLFTRCFLGTHSDSEASLSISPEKNLWHCLGCGVGGSVVDFLMKLDGLSFAHAVQLLKADLPSLAEPSPGAPVQAVKRSTVRRLPGLGSADAEDQELLRAVVEHYHQTLKQSPEALAYLESRGLLSMEAVETFRLGYANRTLGYRLPAKNRTEGAAIRGRLTNLGIFRESGHEHLAGSLVVPIFDKEGRVRQMYGRKIRDDLRKGTPAHLYLPGFKREVWNLEALKQSQEIILCEALLDALTFWCAGYRNVTTAYGVQGMVPELWRAFEVYGTKKVLLAFDRDEAGEQGVERLLPKFQERGIETARIQFPKGMDANEYAQKVKPAEKSLGLVIRNAVWLGAGKPPASQHPDRIPPPAGEVAPGKEEAAKEGKREILEPARPSAIAPVATPTPAPTPAPTKAALPPLVASRITPGPALVSVSASTPAVPPASVSTVYTATPPAAPAPTPALTAQDEDLVLTLGDRSFRVRDLEKNTSSGALKVNVRVSRPDGRFHLDTVDLVVDRQRIAFVKRMAEELGLQEETAKKDVGRLLCLLEDARDARIRAHLAPKVEGPAMSEAERAAALDLLRAPDLLDQVLRDFGRCGVVGEEVNKLLGYLAAVSRKLDHPLAIVIQSSSAAGKSSLMEAVLKFMPGEEQVTYSAMTGQALFYMKETGLAHKILAIAEEEGAERASYALKLLQSEGVLVIAATGKDPTTGKLVTHEYKVEGPVMLFLTTTKYDMDPELKNRCLVLTVDESRSQTSAIHKEQRRRQTLQGLLERKQQDRVVARHRSAQRMLRPLAVVNPFAEELTFLDHQTRTRRDHMKYLTLINAIALLHQFQREVKTARTEDGETVEYIEVERTDIARADALMRETLGHSLDELATQTRRLLAELVTWVDARGREQGIARSEFRFTRRDVREWSGMGNTQLKMALKELEDYEYLLIHAGSRGHSLIYELAYPGPAEGAPGAAGTPTTRASRPLAGASRAQVTGKSGQVGARSELESEPLPASRAEEGRLSPEPPTNRMDTGSGEPFPVIGPPRSYPHPGKANGGGG